MSTIRIYFILYPLNLEATVSIIEPQESTLYHQLAETGGGDPQRDVYARSRLPAIRRCASHHQVSVNTVLSAYRILEDRGLIEARPQSGYYVRGMLPSVKTRGSVCESALAQQRKARSDRCRLCSAKPS